jgi:hypothetical protein
MSRKLVSLIQDNPRLSAKHKRTLEAYAARANNDGTNIFASKKKVGEKVSLSRSTIYHNTPDLIRAGILVQATSHSCKIDACNKGGTHYWGVQGKYTVVYNINLPALENDGTYLLLNRLKVPLPKQLNLFVQNQQKVALPKLDATQSLEPTPVSLSETYSSDLTVGDERASKTGSALSESRAQLKSDCSDGASRKQEPTGLYLEATDAIKSLAWSMHKMIKPIADQATFADLDKMVEGIEYALQFLDVMEAIDLLRWNLSHKSGALIVHNASQFLAMVKGDVDDGHSAMNQFTVHREMDKKCKTCSSTLFYCCPSCKILVNNCTCGFMARIGRDISEREQTTYDVEQAKAASAGGGFDVKEAE